MIEVRIPKDIRKYKTKIVGPFTMRNIVGLAIALGCGAIIYNVLKGIPSDVKLFATMVAAIPGILIGWASFFGMPFEQYAKIAFRNTFLIPKKLLYKTNNAYEPKLASNTNKKKKYVCKNPEFKKYI